MATGTRAAVSKSRTTKEPSLSVVRDAHASQSPSIDSPPADPGHPDVLPDVEGQMGQQQREDTRTGIAYAFVAGYLFLLLLNILIPVILFISSSKQHPFATSDMRDMTAQISVTVSSLLGVLGVVLGYYFKSATDEKQSRRSSGAQRASRSGP